MKGKKKNHSFQETFLSACEWRIQTSLPKGVISEKYRVKATHHKFELLALNG